MKTHEPGTRRPPPRAPPPRDPGRSPGARGARGRRVTATEEPGNSETPRWLLLLYEDSAFRGPAPGAEAEYVEEYTRWAADVREAGTPIEGAELGDAGGLLEPGANLTPREPIADGAGRLTGFFVVTAPSLHEVERLAATSPHLRHGGRIGIRQMR